ncbi:MAG: hypothetical protein CFE23_07905 [Flavobacterium sp. BFFFF1]|uniref:NADPH-dependent F420 reductase n=1 Tax=Flavobacterium sp. BFFFF1 TaxID=2015557 RepID=UPI000BDAE2A8|nr:NADPH-dependent F420 reductase [Flavobacterium sp. BFFFF1]OYU80640.1 MAG: hypothetical protein CFE23_07905 [Flavobacterium sp. BFFFF1]
MKIAFIGIGNVGFALAARLQKCRHEIIIAADKASDSVTKALLQNPDFTTAATQKAIDSSDVVFLATPFMANEEVLKTLSFNGKTLVDCTNPVGPGISHGLNSVISGSERVQQWAPDAKVVKAFSIYGFENLAESKFPHPGILPVMLLSGNDLKAKITVSLLIDDLGFRPLDTGSLDQALHLEHLTLLWIKMVRRDGHHPDFTWAYLEK